MGKYLKHFKAQGTGRILFQVFHVAEVASVTRSNQEFQYGCVETEFLVSAFVNKLG